MGSSVTVFKMSKVSILFVFISLAALFTSGFALDCIQCNGTSIENVCGKDEEGISTTCLSTAIGCGYSNCTSPDGETMIMRFCNYDKPDAIPKTNECQDHVPILDYDCTICACDTDNCNGATMTQISTVGI